MKKRQLIILGVALAILAGAGFLMKFLENQKKPPAQKKIAIGSKLVRTSTVAYQKIDTKISGFGRVFSAQPLDLMSEVSGRMDAKIMLKGGTKFSAGQTLFGIDDTEARLSLQATKSSFMRDIALILPDFKIDFSASYEAWSAYFKNIDPNKPLADLPNPKNDKEKTYLATKNIFTNYYNIKRSESNLEKYSYKAPFSGTVVEVFLEDGSFVNPGAKIARIIRTDKLELKVPIETQDVQWISLGMPVEVSSEDGERTWKGNVTRIGDLVNPNTQAIDVFVSLNTNENRIYEGLYLKATMGGRSVDNAMEIPRAALFNERFVYILKDSSLQSTQVTIHKINQETVIISGIEQGLDVVVEPLGNVNSEMKIGKAK